MIFTEDGNQFFHDAVVEPGGGAHLLLLVRGFDLPDTVHDGGTVHVPAGGVQLLKPQQEPGRPVFVNSHRSGGIHEAAEDLHAVLCVIIILNFHAQILILQEQVVDQQPMVSASVQIENQQPLTGMDPCAGEIEDHRRVGDDDLRDVLCAHGR